MSKVMKEPTSEVSLQKGMVTAAAAPASTINKEKDPTQPYHEVADISLSDYVGVQTSKYATYVPHTAGRYSTKRFRKAQCPIVERLTNSLMMHSRNNGKKLKAVRIVKHAMEMIYLLTHQNPIQVIVDAIVNRGPREDATRIGSAGVVTCKASGRRYLSSSSCESGHLSANNRSP
ncbi:40S ribosomal protein S5-like [Hibiscus syriacus]|nr:40S ribosomal protein S5-like [Hibiscus syriacus]